MGHVRCSVRVYSHFTERDVVARNQPFVPVLLFFPWGCATASADNNQAAQKQATPALASQKQALVSNSAAPLKSVNLFVEETSISFAYPNESLGRAL